MADQLAGDALRARARALRAEARRLDQQAADADRAAEHAAAQQRARNSMEARAAAMCRPVWSGAAREGGPWVVVGIDGGRFVVSLPPTVGGEPGRHEARYAVRSGYPDSTGTHREQWRALGRLDAEATLTAWRAWCAARREVAGG